MKRTTFAVCMMGIVFSAAACDKAPEELASGPAAPAEAHHAHEAGQAGPMVPVMLSFAPGDLSSDIGATPITLFVEQAGQAVDNGVLELVADQIELRTYPGMEPVEADVDIVPAARAGRIVGRRADGKDKAIASEPPRDHAGRASIVVRPLRPLEDRWYVVSLADLPEGTQPVAWTGATDTQLGAFAARFHPGSQPVLRDVRLCEKDEGRAARVIATFSEGMRVDASHAAKLVSAREGQSREACTVVPPAADGVPQTMLEIDCPASVLKSRTIDLGLSAGLASMSGAPLSSIEARGRAVAIADAVDFSEAGDVSGCRTVVIQ